MLLLIHFFVDLIDLNLVVFDGGIETVERVFAEEFEVLERRKLIAKLRIEFLLSKDSLADFVYLILQVPMCHKWCEIHVDSDLSPR